MFFGEYDYDTDIKVQRREAFEDGIAQGERQGRTEGMQTATKNLIQSMFDAGLDSQTISKYTKLSVEQIEMIK